MNYASVGIAFGANLVMARLLTPAEFGLVAIALAMTGLLNALREGGVTAYIIQHKDPGPSVLRAAFTATVALSGVSALLLVALAPLAGRFFNAAEIPVMLWILAAGFVAFPFSVTHAASLQRAMRFKSLLAINVSASLAHSAMALGFVFAGFGVYGLALATSLSNLVYAALCLFMVPDFGRFRFTGQGVPAILRFALAATSAVVLRQIRDGAFAVLGGRFLGPAAVGLAGRAGALIHLYDKMISGIRPVLLPAFAELRRSGGDGARTLLKGHAILSLIATGVYGFLVIVAEPAIVFLYGEQWREAAALVPPLMLAALIGGGLDRLAGPLYTAYGRIDIVWKVQAVLAPVTVAALLVAAPFGLEPALWALVGVAVLAALADCYWLPRLLPVSRRALLAPQMRALIVMAPAFLAGWSLSNAAERWDLPTLPHLLLVGPAYALVALASVFVLRHPLRDELLRLLYRIRMSRQSGAAG